ncbi:MULTISPECIES: HrpT family type III secretion system protein [Dickeya]|uniref:Type III secretion protein HrpT n=1 Tax=Dickeya aquatica TaxID=1401087 RepID=A0A375AB39_9GAMM|nr:MULTISPECIES: HrpT family type III secretion system protein [Dickeya]SLM63260.1 Type III secretion protein HrpT precursor [Dickeya aquatica]
MRYPLLALLCATLLLSACTTTRAPSLTCNNVSCRPEPESRQMVIWWQTDLRPGAADFTQVSVP